MGSIAAKSHPRWRCGAVLSSREGTRVGGGGHLGVHPELEEPRGDEVNKLAEIKLAILICVELNTSSSSQAGHSDKRRWRVRYEVWQRWYLLHRLGDFVLDFAHASGDPFGFVELPAVR